MSDLETGFNTLLEGPSGVGKTYAIGTLVDAGMETFVVFLESGAESLYAYWTDRGLPIPDNLHVHVLKTQKASFKELAESAKRSNSLPYDTLAKMVDPERAKYNAFINLLGVMGKFVDQRTGEDFGAVDEWGMDRVIVIDGLTGVNRAAMQLVIGGRPARSQNDWGHAQHYVEEFLRTCCDGCRCNFVMIAHVEKELDSLNGGMKITMSTLGKALAPKIPQMFSDVILARRDGNTFSWSTADAGADLKNRNLPISDKLKPDFGAIIKKWRSRMAGIMESSDENDQA